MTAMSVITARANPTVLFFDDFRDVAPGESPGGDWTGRIQAEEHSNTLRVRADAEDLFGRGLANQYLELRKETKNSGLALQALRKLNAEVVTFGFSFYEPEGSELLDILDLWIYYDGILLGNAAHRFRVGRGRFYNDTELTFGYDTPVRVELVINNSSEVVTYHDGQAVAAGAADLWVNGELWSEGSTAGRSGTVPYGPIGSFQFNLATGARGLFLVDGFQVVEGAHVGLEVPRLLFDSFEEWQANFFPPEVRDDESIAGVSADPYGRGVRNLVAYSRGESPSETHVAELPRLEIASVEDGDFPALTLPRVFGAHDVDYFVELSDDLVEWHRDGQAGDPTLETVVAEDVGSGLIHVTVRDRKAYGQLSRRFMRLSLDYLGEWQAPQLDPVGEFGSEAFKIRSAAYDMFRYADDPDAGSIAFGGSILLHSYVLRYAATGDRTPMRDFQRQVEKILANRGDRIGLRDEIRDRVMPAWITDRYTDGQDHAWLVHSTAFLSTLARWVYLVEQDPQLRMIYGHLTDRYIAEMQEVVEAFEEDWVDGPGADEGRYFGHTGQALAFNMQHAAGRAFVGLWLLTGEERYRERAIRIANFWKNRVTEVEDRYVWSYLPDGSTIEDISHAGFTVAFAVDAFRAGAGIDGNDIARLVGTFKHVSEGSSGFRWRVDGSGTLADSRLAQRWVYLGMVDKSVRDVYFQWFEHNWSDATANQMIEGAALLAATYTELEMEAPLPAAE